MFSFVGTIITKLIELEVNVKFLRKTNSAFTFPIIEDISLVSRDQIVSLLPDAVQVAGTSRSRTKHQYRFNIDFSLYNMR